MECPYCHIPIHLYSTLHRHVQGAHPTYPQFVCLCGLTFQFRRGLTNHQKICPKEVANIYHPETKRIAREGQYICIECGRKYREMAHLRAHYRDAHLLCPIPEVAK